jgi:D-glycero-alpha-D-manno-heptose-7-phosphate kinase
MLISTSPLRVSLIGGGTDIPGVYSTLGGGGWYSLTIDSYAYAILHKRVSKYESFNFPKIQTDNNKIYSILCKEHNTDAGICCGVDFLNSPSGLGASSALAVCMTEVLTHGNTDVVETAFRIENSLNGCGKQDHYAAYYCGFRKYVVNEFGKVDVGDQIIWNDLTDKMFLLYSEYDSLPSHVTLHKVASSIEKHAKTLELIPDFGKAVDSRNYNDIMSIIDTAWEIKKKTSNSISAPVIDYNIDVLRHYGARGIKLCGSGGGGYILGFHEDLEWLKSKNIGNFLDFSLVNERAVLREF